VIAPCRAANRGGRIACSNKRNGKSSAQPGADPAHGGVLRSAILRRATARGGLNLPEERPKSLNRLAGRSPGDTPGDPGDGSGRQQAWQSYRVPAWTALAVFGEAHCWDLPGLIALGAAGGGLGGDSPLMGAVWWARGHLLAAAPAKGGPGAPAGDRIP